MAVVITSNNIKCWQLRIPKPKVTGSSPVGTAIHDRFGDEMDSLRESIRETDPRTPLLAPRLVEELGACFVVKVSSGQS